MSFELGRSVDTPRRTRASIAQADDDRVDGLGEGHQCEALRGDFGVEMIEWFDAGRRRTLRAAMRGESIDDRLHRSPQPVVDEPDRCAAK